MSKEKVVEKTLPKTDEEVEISITSSGSDGGDVEIEISTPGSGISNRTKESYESDRIIGGEKYWHDVLDNATDEYEIHSRTHTTNSGNVLLKGCYVNIHYYTEAHIEQIVRQLLTALDDGIMSERQRQAAAEKSEEAAQEAVCEDIASRIERMDL
jgi:hypothetical protein